MKLLYGNNSIEVPKNSNFADLKLEILKRDKRLAKSFYFKGEKINENTMIENYPSFSIVFERNEYCEFKGGQFRCKRCRKYLRLTKMRCKHDNKCKSFYILKKKKV